MRREGGQSLVVFQGGSVLRPGRYTEAVSRLKNVVVVMDASVGVDEPRLLKLKQAVRPLAPPRACPSRVRLPAPLAPPQSDTSSLPAPRPRQCSRDDVRDHASWLHCGVWQAALIAPRRPPTRPRPPLPTWAHDFTKDLERNRNRTPEADFLAVGAGTVAGRAAWCWHQRGPRLGRFF